MLQTMAAATSRPIHEARLGAPMPSSALAASKNQTPIRLILHNTCGTLGTVLQRLEAMRLSMLGIAPGPEVAMDVQGDPPCVEQAALLGQNAAEKILVQLDALLQVL